MAGFGFSNRSYPSFHGSFVLIRGASNTDHFLRKEVRQTRGKITQPMNATDFTEWMSKAKDPNDGAQFLKRATFPFHKGREFHSRKVIHGIGRGHQLLRNAEKWIKPEAGFGADDTRAARGQQWRVVMAYGGFEIFAKSIQGNFAVQGGANVSDFMQVLGDFSTQAISIPSSGSIPKGKTPEDMLDFLRTHVGDRAILEKWFSSAGMDQARVEWPRSEVISLARIIRNLTAHGILSADLARKIKVPRLSEILVLALADTWRHALFGMAKP